MKLNCKQGDLAVIVRSESGNEGAIFQCVSFAGLMPCRWEGRAQMLPAWNLDRAIKDVLDGKLPPKMWAIDAAMRPLRDSDGEDEMLRLVGRPVGEPQAA